MNDDIRRLFPITQNFTYLNHAAVSPPPTIAVDATIKQLKDVQTNGSLNYLQWLEAKENCRRLMAQMINCEAEQIAFLRNT
ncbi:MAG: aminotransferase class V-fold PLP-dependent enzyme, partial [Pyrinomonadaceae bacterium]|nr:aminotransferase class V-fold PLP-dependent enzyme [Pyrinomonadaceae bacterium]